MTQDLFRQAPLPTTSRGCEQHAERHNFVGLHIVCLSTMCVECIRHNRSEKKGDHANYTRSAQYTAIGYWRLLVHIKSNDTTIIVVRAIHLQQYTAAAFPHACLKAEITCQF